MSKTCHAASRTSYPHRLKKVEDENCSANTMHNVFLRPYYGSEQIGSDKWGYRQLLS